MARGAYGKRGPGSRKNSMIVALIKRLASKEKVQDTVNSQTDEASELIDNIKRAKADWSSAYQNFEYAGEQGIVDYYTYNIKACQVRYEYYLKLAKEKGIRLDSLDDEGVRSG